MPFFRSSLKSAVFGAACTSFFPPLPSSPLLGPFPRGSRRRPKNPFLLLLRCMCFLGVYIALPAAHRFLFSASSHGLVGQFVCLCVCVCVCVCAVLFSGVDFFAFSSSVLDPSLLVLLFPKKAFFLFFCFVRLVSCCCCCCCLHFSPFLDPSPLHHHFFRLSLGVVCALIGAGADDHLITWMCMMTAA